MNWLQSQGIADPDGTNWQDGQYYSNPQVVWSPTNGPYGGYIVKWSGGSAGSATGGGGDIASAGPLETPNETFAAIAGTPIPVSGGQRRINGRPIDRIFRSLNEDGSGSRIVMCSCGYPLFDVSNELTRVTAGATTIWENGASTHEDVASVTWYEGDEDQIQDPVFTTKNGATLQPAYRGQMIGVVDFTSLRDWNNVEPALTFFITDAIGGTLFRPWGGSWDQDHKGATVVLTDDDMTCTTTGTWDAVRSTASHSSGRRYFEFEINSVGSSGSLGVSFASWGLTDESSLADYSDHMLGSTTSGTYGHTLFDGTTRNAGAGAGSGTNSLGALVAGQRYGVAFDLDIPGYWITNDGVVWHGPTGGPAGDPVNGTNPQGTDFHGFTEYYIAWNGYDSGDSITLFTDEGFLFTAPGTAGNVTQAEIIVATGEMSKLRSADILVDPSVDDLEEGITITNGLSWPDYLKSTGSILNFDFWEYGRKIQVKRVAFDSPAIDLDGIPENHRLKCDDEKGSTLSFDGAERSKAAVVNLNFLESSRQFQNSMVPARSEAPDSAEEINITSPLIMPATLASLRANIALFKTEMESQAHEQCLPPISSYMALLPADVVRFASEGKTYTLKVKAWTLESDFTIRTEYHTLLSLSEDLVADAIAGIPQFAGAYAGEPTDPHYPQTEPGGTAQRLFPMHLMGN